MLFHLTTLWTFITSGGCQHRLWLIPASISTRSSGDIHCNVTLLKLFCKVFMQTTARFPLTFFFYLNVFCISPEVWRASWVLRPLLHALWAKKRWRNPLGTKCFLGCSFYCHQMMKMFCCFESWMCCHFTLKFSELFWIMNEQYFYLFSEIWLFLVLKCCN